MLNEFDMILAERGVNTLVLRILLSEVSKMLRAEGKNLPDTLWEILTPPLSEPGLAASNPARTKAMHDYMLEYLADLLKAPRDPLAAL